MNRPSMTKDRRPLRFDQVSIMHQTIDERYEMNDAPLMVAAPSSRDDFLNTMSLRKVLMEHDFYCKSKRTSLDSSSCSSSEDLMASPPSSGSGKGKVLMTKGKKHRDELDNSNHDRRKICTLSPPTSPGSSSLDDLDTSHHERRDFLHHC